MSEALLSIRGLSNTYLSRDYGFFGKVKEKRALNNVSLEIKNGEIFGLTGISGCGKTTLAKCVLGLIDYEGEILLQGEKHAKKAGIIFQEPGASLNPKKKIGWLIEEPLVISGKKDALERKREVDKALLRVGLDPSYKTRKVHELSGGQKQRVCIARALILEPALLIADEAISSLDVSAGARILNLFHKLNKTSGLGVLFISHNINAVQYLCGRTAFMENGKIERIS